VIGTSLFALVALPWLLLVVRPNVPENLADYWRDGFLDGDRFAGGLGPRLIAVARGFQGLDATFVLVVLLAAAVVVLARRPAVGALLVLPTVTAVLLAAFRLVPLGTGRTDIYLFPSYALLLAIATAEVGTMLSARGVPSFARSLTMMLAIVGVVLVATPIRSDAYPREEVASLVRLVERERRPADVVVVYRNAAYAYGLSTRYPVARRPDPGSATGWSVKVDSPGVVVLRAAPDRSSRSRDMIGGLIRRAPRVWLIASHLHDDWRHLRWMVRDAGYRRAQFHERPGAQLVLFVREGTGATPARGR
jgi:hypothetical protein